MLWPMQRRGAVVVCSKHPPLRRQSHKKLTFATRKLDGSPVEFSGGKDATLFSFWDARTHPFSGGSDGASGGGPTPAKKYVAR